eukprot:689339-Rhodomonas_salina.3
MGAEEALGGAGGLSGAEQAHPPPQHPPLSPCLRALRPSLPQLPALTCTASPCLASLTLTQLAGCFAPGVVVMLCSEYGCFVSGGVVLRKARRSHAESINPTIQKSTFGASWAAPS